MRTTLQFADPDTLLQNSLSASANSVAWCADSGVIDRFLSTRDPYLALRIWLEKDESFSELCWDKKTVRPALVRAIRELDERINRQLNEVLHHDSFQRLEASWRGLHYLTEQAAQHDGEMTSKVKLISLSWRELSKDISRAIEFDQSEFFKLVYSNEFDMPGGEPFGLLIGDYKIDHRPKAGIPTNDIDTLKGISSTAAAAFAPFVTSAEPSLFGVDYFSELATVRDIHAQFSQPEYLNWRSLREMEDSRFLGIAMPHILMRTPYRSDGSRKQGFHFEEQIRNPKADYLWGNAAYGFASVLLRTYSEGGWFSQIRGLQPGLFKHGLVTDLPCHQHQSSRRTHISQPSVDLQVGDHLEKQLSDSGFIPVSPVPHTDHLVFLSNASVSKPVSFDSLAASVNARLSSMLQYILCVARFAHYIKVMGRDRVGTYETAASIETDLQRWLHNYTSASDVASEETRARYPLNEARIQVKEKRGQPGRYYSVIHLRPHFQLDQMMSSVRLVTELSPRFSNAV